MVVNLNFLRERRTDEKRAARASNSRSRALIKANNREGRRLCKSEKEGCNEEEGERTGRLRGELRAHGATDLERGRGTGVVVALARGRLLVSY
jgi:hypothetical protein